MVDLSIAIQHTPGREDRRRWVQAMCGQIRNEDAQLQLSVIEDLAAEGCWPTHRRALEAVGSASHHLVLQDDVGLCGDFLYSVEQVIRAMPGHLISLYSNAQQVHGARALGDAWIVDYACGPAVIWPSHLIVEFLNWQERFIDAAFAWDNVRVSMWLIKTARQSFATVPSLVQHLGCTSSILGLNHPSKVAAWWIGEDRSGADVDWTRGREAPLEAECKIQSEWWDYYHEDEAREGVKA